MNHSLSLKHSGIFIFLLLLVVIIQNPALAVPGTLDEAVSANAKAKLSNATHKRLLANISQYGSARVIVGLASAKEPDAALTAQQITSPQLRMARQASIARLQNQVLNQLSKQNIGKVRQFKNIPFMALEADNLALTRLLRQSEVVSIQEDRLQQPSLDVSIPLIGADLAWAAGYSGTGQTVAVLDSGVDKFHSFLSGKVVSEACFSTTNASFSSTTTCPNGLDSQIGDGAGVNCTITVPGCDHGTHVAGIAAGDSTAFSGVAKDANLIAIQVFSIFNDALYCGGPPPCILSWNSDTIAGLDHVYTLSSSFDVASVNLSLGGGYYTSEAACDSDNTAYKSAIDNLRTVNIATVAASGNDGFTTGMGAPGCISTAISVGATSDFDVVAGFSNSVSFLDLLAPGVSIFSSVPGSGFQNKSGTSMATPHTAGAWAVLKSAAPAATINEVLTALNDTGVPVTDTRNGLVFPRIQVDDAANALVGTTPLAIDTTALPDGTVGEAYNETLTASGGTPPYSWSIIAGSLPGGLSLDPVSGVISGIPTTQETASFTVQVQDDAADTSTQALSIIINVTPNLIISADYAEDVFLNGISLGSSRDWQQSSAYLAAIQEGPNVLAVRATGSSGSPSGLVAEMDWNGFTAVTDSSWKVSTAWQPGWQQLGFNDSTWAAASGYGSYGVAPWATNVTGFPNPSSAQWIWSADNVNDNTVYFRYHFTVISTPLTINTATLPDAAVGEQYRYALSAAGGEPPYQWDVVAGSLPDGLSLDSARGIITGVPTAEDISNFTVEVQDSNSNTAAQALSLTVDSAPLNILLSADNANEVYLNGVQLGSSTAWQVARSYTAPLQSGVNVVAAKATDTGGIGALIAELAWGTNNAVTDSSWKVSTVLESGWEQPGFDDSSWSAATAYGAYGIAPWLQNVRRFPAGSTAQWIWSADNDADDEVYFRYTIILP